MKSLMQLVATIGAVALMTASVSAQQKAAGADEAAIAKVRTAYQTAAAAQDRRGDREAVCAGRRRDAAERAGGEGARRDRGVPQGVRPSSG